MSAAYGATAGAALEARSPPAHERIASEHASYSAVTAAVTDPILVRPAGRAWWIAFGVSAAAVLVMLVAVGMLSHARHWHLERQHHGRVGLRHRELRLVDRGRQRRHAHLLHPGAHTISG